MTMGPIELSRTELPTGRLRRTVRLSPAMMFGIGVFALTGWAWAAYERFVDVPSGVAAQRIATALDLVDRFSDSEAQRAYEKLSEDLKPWWEMIQEQQRRIMAATSDAEREPLIAKRDEQLLAFIREHGLGASVDQLVAGFEQFERCLAVGACDEDVIRKSISIDVKRLYRTFKPYIQAKRETLVAEERDRDYGKGLESLFFRFLS